MSLRMKGQVIVQQILRFMLALGVVALGTAVLFRLRGFLSAPVIAILYLLTVIISAVLGGRLAGITASVLSFLCFNYLFVQPYYTLIVQHPQDLMMMVVMLGVSVLFSSLMARAQSRLEEVQERERQALQLYELNNALLGQSDALSIAQTLAQRLTELFPVVQVEVELTLPDAPAVVRLPQDTVPAGEPVLLAPLKTPDRQLGEVRLWGLKQEMRPQELRLLYTFTGQSALALERAVLAARDRRARLLEESDRLKTAILSSVSHELRTPLASIQASATSLFNPSVQLEPEARAELQSVLLEETEHLTQLVGNLLNMSRLEAGALKLDREWNSLSEIVEIAIRRLKRFLGRQEVQVNISDDLSLVAVDSVLMEQVFINLISNSLKFSPPGRPICISAEADSSSILVSVRNQGPPIEPQYLDHIFEKFYPIPTREASRGTGLGLSICKGIVEAHDGRIWAENLADGVAFKFTLPLTFEGARPPVLDEEGE